MANYTTRVYDILNSLNNNTISGYSINKIIEEHWGEIFDLDIWNTYDETYKKTLCCKILRHYLMYEIGSETVGLWKFNLNSHLAEIMPKYNAMYANIEKAYANFFEDTNFSETYNKTESEEGETTGTESGTSKENASSTGTQENETSANSKTTNSSESTQNVNAQTESTTTATNQVTNSGNSDGWQASSDTPQGQLSNVDTNKYLSSAVHNYGKTGAESTTEATNTGTSDSTNTGKTTSRTENSATSEGNTSTTTNGKTESNGETSSNSTANSSRALTENYVKSVIGKMGSENNAKLFNEISNNLINIDLQIINELKEDFILLWE